MTIFCVSYMWIHSMICLTSVKLKFWTETVMSPQHLHINNCNLSFSFYQFERNKCTNSNELVNCIVLMIKQARKQKMQGGYSKYSLFMKILCRISVQFTAQSKSCHVTATILWQGRLKIRVYNPRKITKYGVLVRMVWEAL